MLPTIAPGQGLVATPWGRPRTGQIRVFEHPERAGFWLVKRVESVDGESMTVVSDNVAAAGAVDSRTLGPVPTAGSYRVVFRVPMRLM